MCFIIKTWSSQSNWLSLAHGFFARYLSVSWSIENTKPICTVFNVWKWLLREKFNRNWEWVKKRDIKRMKRFVHVKTQMVVYSLHHGMINGHTIEIRKPKVKTNWQKKIYQNCNYILSFCYGLSCLSQQLQRTLNAERVQLAGIKPCIASTVTLFYPRACVCVCVCATLVSLFEFGS